MCAAAALNRTISQKPLDFTELHAAFKLSLQQAFEQRDVRVLKAHYDSFVHNTDHDKKSPLDQAFRELLLFELSDNVPGIGVLIKLSAEAARLEIVSVTIPVVLLSDIFETVTLDLCDRIFTFVEEMVDIWKEELFFTSSKNNILRMCNDLLRRLSRAQNTVFCGRILLFLSKFFPFSERSGLNIVSEFNLENVTEYGVDGKDLDDTLEETVEDVPIKIDYNLYCKFWSLQDFFRNPNQCYSKAQWKMFQAHAGAVLEAFASFKLEEQRLSTKSNKDDAEIVLDTDVDMEAEESSLRKSEHFFAKFLTNPKLLALQLSDSNFRRSVLVQFLILFQYLQVTVKFKSDSNTLTSAQTDFIKETASRVYGLLEETPPNGKRFARTVQHMLEREEMWNNWKNEGCKEFKKPDELEAAQRTEDATADEESKPSPPKRAKRLLGDCLREANRSGKFYLGNDNLTRLWNYSPDNLQACKSEERNFLPQLETFLENMPEKSDASFEWRALRLLARQSPHFFTFVNMSSCKISEYLETVRRKLLRDKLDNVKTTASGNIIVIGSNSQTENNEVETVALQEQDNEQDADANLVAEVEAAALEKTVDDDQNMHTKPVAATHENLLELAPLIANDWKKLGKKLGYTLDEMLYYETEHKSADAACIVMLTDWFADDDDASLDNLAYILEGLEINNAANAVKTLLDKLVPIVEVSD